MALVTVEIIEVVRTTDSNRTRAYSKQTARIDDTTISAAVEVTTLDGTAVVLDDGQGVWKMIQRGGYHITTDDTGKAALGF